MELDVEKMYGIYVANGVRDDEALRRWTTALEVAAGSSGKRVRLWDQTTHIADSVRWFVINVCIVAGWGIVWTLRTGGYCVRGVIDGVMIPITRVTDGRRTGYVIAMVEEIVPYVVSRLRYIGKTIFCRLNTELTTGQCECQRVSNVF